MMAQGTKQRQYLGDDDDDDDDDDGDDDDDEDCDDNLSECDLASLVRMRGRADRRA
jgi:hypothetical protein